MSELSALSGSASRNFAALLGEHHGRSWSQVTVDGIVTVFRGTDPRAAMGVVHLAMALGAVDLVMRRPSRGHLALGIALGLGALWIAGQSPSATRRYER